ncbi:MAG: hypothetical protein ABL921_04500 [Pirellula sp.]
MRKTWFQSLALTLGVCTLPGTAMAQYSMSNSGAGLAASSFNANSNTAGNRGYPGMAQGQASLAAYAQNGAVGSGLSGGNAHVHVPAVENPILNTQYQSVPHYSAPAAQPYEQQPMTSVQPSVQQHAPMANAATTVSSCPACSSGNCATHGVGMPSGQVVTTTPNYGAVGYGSAASCVEPMVNYGPSISSPSPWIFGASGLLFNRIDTQTVRLTSDSTNPDNPLLTTTDAKMRATGGVQFSVGRYFGSGRYALVGSYWGIFSNPQTAAVQAPVGGNLRSNLPFTLSGPNALAPYGIEMPGQNVYNWYDGAFAHRIRRDQEFHNAELNLFSFALGGGARQPYAGGAGGMGGGAGLGGGRLRGMAGGAFGGGGACGSSGDSCQSSCEPTACASSCGPTGPCAPWFGAQCSKLRLNMFGGVRWFRFRDSFEYATSETDNIYGTTADDFYYRNGVTNDLVGFQLGTLANWCTGTRVNLFAGTSFGIYGNHITADTRAGTTDTAATIVSANSFNGRAYDYSNTLNDIAFLGEGNLGAGFRISRGWTANLGYRVVGVNGVATAVGQIPRDFSLGNDLNRINNYNSLILHGLVVGANYNF